MSNINDNPVLEIFESGKDGKCSQELKNIDKIKSFWNYLEDENKPQKGKIKLINEFIEIIKINRYICEYFSTIKNSDNMSIYIFLFDLYLNPKSSLELKNSILNLIKELIINIEISKDICEFIFEKLSLLYKDDGQVLPEKVKELLTLLNTILDDTTNYQKPFNYFACPGNSNFELLLSNNKLEIGKCLSLIINFKICNSALNKEDAGDDQIVSLMKLDFSNGQSFSLDLKYPMFLIAKEIHSDFIKTLPIEEWVNLIFTIVNVDNKLQVYFFVNGENKLSPYKLPSKKLKPTDTIDSIIFFDKFKGEVSSMSLFIQSNEDRDKPNVLNNFFLSGFKQFQKGIWKRKIFDKFLKFLGDINKKDVSKDLVFLFTPFNYSNAYPKMVENSVENSIRLKLNGPIMNHKYQCYQKKLTYLGVIQNFFPIGELFLIHPEVLDENNFILFLSIIKNMLNYRKNNIKCAKEIKFFQILSLFIEKFPSYLFSEKILELFNQIGKIIFSNNFETLCRSYFKHILLNEKILSKYPEDLQIKFWNQILLFCESDKEQIETFVQMNRICLILRFYDKNKYTEMCCEKHLSMIKEEFNGNKAIMNPPMNQKLSNLENILNVIIDSQEPKNVIYLFKLLTLDLSPCLIKFILNIFINAFEKETKDNSWKNQLLDELLKINYETIMVNTFIHNLPDIRYDILTLAYYIHLQMVINNKENCFEKFESMIKTCLLPQNMFYATKKESKSYKKLLEQKEEENKKNEDTKKIQRSKRGSTFLPTNLDNILKDNKNLIDKNKKSNNANIQIENSDSESKSESQSDSESSKSGEKQSDDESKEKKDIEDERDKILDNYLKSDSDIAKMRTFSKKEKNERFFKNNIREKTEKEKEKENKEVKNENINEENEDLKDDEKIIIIKDEYYKEYFQRIFDILLLWFLGEKTNISINSINLNDKSIKNPKILKILFFLEKDINNISFTNNLLNTIYCLIIKPKNAFLLLDDIIMSSFLDLAFKFYFYKSDPNYKESYDLCKEILLQIYIASMNSEEKKDKLLPCYYLEIIFTWADKILTEDELKTNQLYNFIYEFLYAFIEKFNVKYERKMNFIINDADFDMNNYYLTNYLMMHTHLFNFSFHFCWDLKDINLFDDRKENFEVILGKYFNTLRFNSSNENSINEKWPDYIFFYDIYKKLSSTWNLKNLYKKFSVYENKKNKKYKFEEILNKIILDKSHKNLYKTHLQLLCFREENNGIEIITPLIKTIPITLMNLILMASKFQNEADYNYWLKEYKHFIIFIIIATCNIIRENQTELYNIIQTLCLGPIVTSIIFLDYLAKNLNYKEKAIKSLNNIILFCFIILEYEYNYITKHKSGVKLLSFSSKPLKNDLRMSAVFLLFTEYIKDKNDNVIFTLQNLEEIKDNTNYLTYYKLVDNADFNQALYNNKVLTEKIFINFFTLSSYKNIINNRIFQMPLLKDELEYEYIDEILKLLPLYEKELMKYSNNSLEKNIKKKNGYKIIKKKSFSWNGFWSDKKLFFQNIESLKLKMKNHYTKTFMKPLLVPILDIDYYLPELNGFKKEDLFLPSNKKHYKLILDIDKILKLREQKQIMLNNIKESFGEKKTEAKENYLRSIYIKSNKKLSEKLLEISNNLDLGKEEEFTFLENDTNNTETKQQYFLSCLVKTSHHIKGVCFIDDNNLNFKVFLNQKTGNAMNGVELAFTNEDDDYDQDRNTCFGSYLVCHHKDKDLYKISINYNDIKWIIRRRYYYKNSALEIFTTTNKSYYFNFKFEKDREIVINEITSKFKSLSKIINDLKDPKDSFDNIVGYGNNLVKNKIKLSKLINKWKEWKITNFEILMWLNIFGNRSYNDISQYPVFPWILSNYEDPLKSNKIIKNIKEEKDENENNNENEDEDEENEIDYYYRDLTLPMGMMEMNDDGARKELFMETFETLKSESDQEIKPYIYGSNYSNPIYVCNFLVRIFPFTHISIELQGNRLDDPNRLFFSVNQSFLNSTTQKTDVRELMPEFFYLPEIFTNINELNLGIRDDGKQVNDVLTPCDNNPYEFIFTMKKILESSQISKNIRKWIDLIFGYKARGKEAELSNNVFTESSYQESININNIENKESYLRLVEFGLIPTQIMNKECSKREKKEDIIKGKELSDPKGKFIYEKCPLYLEVSENSTNINYKENIFSLKVGCFSSNKLTIFLSNNLLVEEKISYNPLEKSYIGELSNKYNLNYKYNYMKMFYSSDILDKTICFYNKGKDLIIGGFYDGSILITNFSQKSKNENDPIKIIRFKDEKPILSIEIDKEEKFLFLGNSIGNIYVYNREEIENNKKNENINNNWKKYCLLTDQNSSISSISCNNELNLWASITNDGYICLYTLPLCNLIRVIKAQSKLYSYIFLSDSPLPCIIAISDDDNSEISVYSINGKLIFKKQEYNRVSSPIIIKDLNSNDHLIFIGNNNITIMSLPDLNIETNFENLIGINSICISEDNKTLYAINKSGSETYIIKEDSKIKLLSSILHN